jgi:hypothetical protein
VVGSLSIGPMNLKSFLFALLGLNRAGRILYTTLFVVAIPALLVKVQP